MSSPKFQRTIEDFICGHCGHAVTGGGYTNHCPACLWSKHVDVQPGDRAEQCGGLMEPVVVAGKSHEYRLLHHCLQCGAEKWNRAATGDDFEVLLQIAAQQSMG